MKGLYCDPLGPRIDSGFLGSSSTIHKRVDGDDMFVLPLACRHR